MPPNANDAATVLNFLGRSEPPRRALAVIAFGHFDLRIPAKAAELFEARWCEWIICTGGIGAGTADLGQPEAQAFGQYIAKRLPHIPNDRIIIEDRSTNTAENLRFTARLLRDQDHPLELSAPGQQFLLVANPYRQRRVWLTWRKLFPHSIAINCPPPFDLESERQLFARKGESLEEHLVGELERIETYPDRGWIERETIPPEVSAAGNNLRQH